MSSKKNFWIRVDQPHKPYYFNALTRQTTVKKPKELAEDEARIAACMRKQKVIAIEHVDMEWSIAVDNMGNWFWYNEQTRQSLWTIPDDLSNSLIAAYHRRKQTSSKNETVKLEEVDSIAEEDGRESDALEEYELVDYVDFSDEESAELDNDVDIYEAEPQQDDISDSNVPEVEIKEPQLTEEQMEAEYFELLDTLEINAFSMFEVVMKKVESDVRFQRLPENRAKSLFNAYCSTKTTETKASRADPQLDAYMQLLEEKVDKSSRWEIFQHQFRRDPRFKQLLVSEREKVFKKYLNALKQPQNRTESVTEEERREKALEARKKIVLQQQQLKVGKTGNLGNSAKSNAREKFMALLMDHVPFSSRGRFDQITSLIEHDPRHAAIDDVLDSAEQPDLIELHFHRLFEKLKESFAEILASIDNQTDVNMTFGQFCTYASTNTLFQKFLPLLNDDGTRSGMKSVFESVMHKKRNRDVDDFVELLKEMRSALVYKFISSEKQKAKIKQEDLDEGYDVIPDAEFEEETIVTSATQPQAQIPVEQRVSLRDAERLLEHDERYRKLSLKPALCQSLIKDWILATATEYAREKSRLP